MLRAMTENSNYEPIVQMGASAVLVAIGHEYLDLVSNRIIILKNQLHTDSNQ